MPPNHEKLYSWWCGSGPKQYGELSIADIERILISAREEGVVVVKSPAGWNYAVLKFLIQKCSLPNNLKEKLVNNANPQNGNYGIWRRHRLDIATVLPTQSPENITRIARSKATSNSKGFLLTDIVSDLQKAIANNQLNKEMVNAAIIKFEDLGYAYDFKKYPPLVGTENYPATVGESPCNLSEALLWKLGKWQTYKKFVVNYGANEAKALNTDVVFFAFAKHLKDKENPIYDQHCLRALWAIKIDLSDDEKMKCQSLLFDTMGKWKLVGGGKSSIACYELFLKHIELMTSQENAPSKFELDRLLMPLGKVIKKSTNSFSEFKKLCGWI